MPVDFRKADLQTIIKVVYEKSKEIVALTEIFKRPKMENFDHLCKKLRNYKSFSSMKSRILKNYFLSLWY